MKRLDFINKRLCEKNEARAYINNVDEAMLEYCREFTKQIKSLPPEPQLSDFYHPSEGQKNGEILFVSSVKWSVLADLKYQLRGQNFQAQT